MKISPIQRGVLFALVAAVSFGITAPLIQQLSGGTGPAPVAALLYLGAALAALGFRSPAAREAPLDRRHWPRLVIVALCGAFLAPLALVWGLQRSNGTAASLLLNFEAVFTFGLGLAIYREHAGSRVILAAVAIATGGALLTVVSVRSGTSSLIGLTAILLATLFWAMDNALSRGLADINPGSVVLGKGLIGAGISVLTALVLQEQWPTPWAIIGLVLCGAVGYGFSLRFYLLAQRTLGAARTGSVFATAPFVGAGVAVWFGHPFTGVLSWGAALLMGAGVYLHMTEHHDHWHTHSVLEHTHAHRHDEGHHGHEHDVTPSGAHSHAHTHGSIKHRHAHGADLHHRHDHDE
jgi:drug/metabolite transporter (DMT)-like permease